MLELSLIQKLLSNSWYSSLSKPVIKMSKIEKSLVYVGSVGSKMRGMEKMSGKVIIIIIYMSYNWP